MGALRLTDEQAGDQEAGDDEEDVDPDEPAVERADPRVVEHHEQHGHGPQALDVGPEAAPSLLVRPGSGEGGLRGAPGLAQSSSSQSGRTGPLSMPALASTWRACWYCRSWVRSSVFSSCSSSPWSRMMVRR